MIHVTGYKKARTLRLRFPRFTITNFTTTGFLSLFPPVLCHKTITVSTGTWSPARFENVHRALVFYAHLGGAYVMG
jgi:hypothetical protein